MSTQPPSPKAVDEEAESFISSLKGHLTERIFSPLSGAFVLSWIALNHFYIVILLSDDNVPTKMKLGRELIFGSTADIIWRGLLLPFLLAVAFIVTYPFVSSCLYFVWYYGAKFRKDLKAKVDGDTRLSKEESQRIRREFNEIFQKNQDLQTQLATLGGEFEKLKTESSNMVTKLSETKRRSGELSLVANEAVAPYIPRLIELLRGGGLPPLPSELLERTSQEFGIPLSYAAYTLSRAKSEGLITDRSGRVELTGAAKRKMPEAQSSRT